LDVERQPSRLPIETIDAFNAWLAASCPYPPARDPRFKSLPTRHPVTKKRPGAALAHETGDVFGAAVDRCCDRHQRWRRLRELIADMLPDRDRWLPCSRADCRRRAH